jgi:23S rRNA (adenine2503-C2)-methyltransferase
MTALPLVFDAPKRALRRATSPTSTPTTRRAAVGELGLPGIRAISSAATTSAGSPRIVDAMTDLPAAAREGLAGLLPRWSPP